MLCYAACRGAGQRRTVWGGRGMANTLALFGGGGADSVMSLCFSFITYERFALGFCNLGTFLELCSGCFDQILTYSVYQGRSQGSVKRGQLVASRSPGT